MALFSQEDEVIDPEEDANPIIETKEEKDRRIEEFCQGDADDVKPYERRENDDQMNPPTMMH